MRLFIGSCVSLAKQYVKSVAGCYSQPCVVCFHRRPATSRTMWNMQMHKAACKCTGNKRWKSKVKYDILVGCIFRMLWTPKPSITHMDSSAFSLMQKTPGCNGIWLNHNHSKLMLCIDTIYIRNIWLCFEQTPYLIYRHYRDFLHSWSHHTTGPANQSNTWEA